MCIRDRMEAVLACKVDVIKYLIEHGADINMQDNAGCTALMRASYSGYVDLVLYLLDQGADKSIKDFQGKDVYKRQILRS